MEIFRGEWQKHTPIRKHDSDKCRSRVRPLLEVGGYKGILLSAGERSSAIEELFQLLLVTPAGVEAGAVLQYNNTVPVKEGLDFSNPIGIHNN